MAKQNRRQRGEDSIYLRKDGRWCCQVFLGTRPDGKPERRWLYGKTPDDVIEKRNKFRQKIAEGFTPAKGKGESVGDWMHHWLHNIVRKEVRESTWNRSYRSKVENHVIPGLGWPALTKLDEEDIEAFYADLKDQGLSPASILQIHRILSRALKVAVKRKKIQRNPCQLVTPPRVDPAEPMPPERDEAALILSTTAERRNGARWAFALSNGPRQGEALGLLWPMLDLDDPNNATVRIAWELTRLPWQHGCEDQHACGKKRHRFPCPPNPEDCEKARRKAGRRHTCQRPCPPRCREHDGKCLTFCPPDCTKHASGCPQRHGGGLVLTEPKSKKSRRTSALPREVARRLISHRKSQAAERLAHPAWVGWGHDSSVCDRRPRARELVCAKCRLPIRKDLLVFTQPNGQPVDPRRDWQEWADLLAELQLPHYRIHDSRHFSATMALEEGVDVVVVQEMLGHATPAFTQEVYQHVRPRVQRDAADKIGTALFGDSQSDSARDADGRGDTRKRRRLTRG